MICASPIHGNHVFTWFVWLFQCIHISTYLSIYRCSISIQVYIASQRDKDEAGHLFFAPYAWLLAMRKKTLLKTSGWKPWQRTCEEIVFPLAHQRVFTREEWPELDIFIRSASGEKIRKICLWGRYFFCSGLERENGLRVTSILRFYSSGTVLRVNLPSEFWPV